MPRLPFFLWLLLLPPRKHIPGLPKPPPFPVQSLCSWKPTADVTLETTPTKGKGPLYSSGPKRAQRSQGKEQYGWFSWRARQGPVHGRCEHHRGHGFNLWERGKWQLSEQESILTQSSIREPAKVQQAWV